MYQSYFHISRPAFENSLDQQFFFFSPHHKEVLAALLYFVISKKGFAVVCGDVGTGKTMLIHHLLTKLPPYVLSLQLPLPEADLPDLLRAIGNILKVDIQQSSSLEMTTAIKEALTEAEQRGEQFLLIVDEAQLLSDRSLEYVRLLSNIESNGRQLIQILLVGQYELSERMGQYEFRQLRQRINVNRVLNHLTHPQTIEYIDHRLRVVGSSFSACFEPGCEKLLYQFTKGVPRLINQVCDSALLIGKVEESPRVSPRILRKALEAMNSDVIFRPDLKPERPYSGRFKILLSSLTLAICLGLIVTVAMIIPPELRRRYAGMVIRQATAVLTDEPETSMSEERLSPPLSLGAYELEHRSLNPQMPASQEAGTVEKEMDLASPTIEEPEEAPLASTESIQQIDGLEYSSPDPIPAERQLPAFDHAGAIGGKDAAAWTTPSLSGTEALPVQIRQIPMARGESLRDIAAKWYPDNPTFGRHFILLVNPELTDSELVYPGRMVQVPEIRLENSVLALAPSLHYFPYGFYSPDEIKALESFLVESKINHIIAHSLDAQGSFKALLVVGGYPGEEELKRSLDLLRRHDQRREVLEKIRSDMADMFHDFQAR